MLRLFASRLPQWMKIYSEVAFLFFHEKISIIENTGTKSEVITQHIKTMNISADCPCHLAARQSSHVWIIRNVQLNRLPAHFYTLVYFFRFDSCDACKVQTTS